MDLCHEIGRFNPINVCLYGLLCSAISIFFLIFHIIYLIKLHFADRRASLHSGYLPFIFLLSCVLNASLLVVPFVYLLVDHNTVIWDERVAIFLVGHSVFWMISLITRVSARNLPDAPLPNVLAEGAAALLAIGPLFFSRTFFNVSGALSAKRLFFYVFELFFILLLLFGTATRRTLRLSSYSNTAWSGFSRKTAMVLPFIWPRKSALLQLRVLLCFLLLIVGRFINVSLPLYSKWIVDGLSKPNAALYRLILWSSFLKFLQGNGAMGGFLNTIRSYLWIPIQQYTTYEVQVKLFEHLHDLSLRWHLSRKTGQVLRVMDRGTASIDSILNYFLFNIVPTMADIIIAVVFFFASFNYYFGMLVFLTMVAYLALTIVLTEWRTKFRRDMNEKENFSRAIGVDSLLNYETVKYYCAEPLEVNRFAGSIRRYQMAEWASSASLSVLNLSQNGTIGIALAAGSVLVAYLIASDHESLTAGDYVLFTTYMLQLYAPLNFFGTVYRVIQRSFIDMENMIDLLKEDVEIVDSPTAIPLVVDEGTLVFENVSFGYTPRRMVIDNVSFCARKGETIALVGPSGAGKSTIIRLLFRLYDVTDGRILVDGHDVRDLQMRSLRQHIGIVPQDTVLFNESIRYNIRFGNPEASEEMVEDAARAAEIHEKVIGLPDGYDTIVGERGLKLSGGEKQRIAIARTLLKQPNFILLDEATSALDTATERSIQKCLGDMCESRTTVVVAHRLSTIVNANRILVLDQGRIVESGTHAELLERRGRYYNMWQAQSEDSNGSDVVTLSNVSPET